MERSVLKLVKEAMFYIVPATGLVLVQIYHKKSWIGAIQTFSLFFGSIFIGVLFTEPIRIFLEVQDPKFMEVYGARLDYFIVGFAVIVGFYLLLFLFAKEEIFKIFNKLSKKGK